MDYQRLQEGIALNQKQIKIALIMVILLSVLSVIIGIFWMPYDWFYWVPEYATPGLVFLFAIPILLIGGFLFYRAKDKKPD